MVQRSMHGGDNYDDGDYYNEKGDDNDDEDDNFMMKTRLQIIIIDVGQNSSIAFSVIHLIASLQHHLQTKHTQC